MNYSELIIAVSDTCENTFSPTDMATFVQQAEQKIYNTVQIPALRRNSTGNLVTGNKYLSAPEDFLSVFSLAVIKQDGEYVYMVDKDVNFIREAYPKPTDIGVPMHYAIFGPRSDNARELSIIVGPTPDAGYDVELHYNSYPESIVTAGDTWLGDNFDAALLNGALIEAIRFMKGEQDMVALYKGMYDQAMMLLKGLGDGKLRQDAYRSGQVRVKVS